MNQKNKQAKNILHGALGRRYTRLLASVWISTAVLLIAFSLIKLFSPHAPLWSVAVATLLTASLIRYIIGDVKRPLTSALERLRKWFTHVVSTSEMSGALWRRIVFAVLVVAVLAIVFAYSFIAFSLLRWMPDNFPSWAALIFSAEVVCAALIPRRLVIAVEAQQRKWKKMMRERSRKRQARRGAELDARIQAAQSNPVALTPKWLNSKSDVTPQALPAASVARKPNRRRFKHRRIHKYKPNEVEPSVYPREDLEKIFKTFQKIQTLQEEASRQPVPKPRAVNQPPQTMRSYEDWQEDVDAINKEVERLHTRANYLDFEARCLARQVERDGFDPLLIAKGLAVLTEWAETLEAMLELREQLMELKAEADAQAEVEQLKSTIEAAKDSAQELKPEQDERSPRQYVVTIRFKPEHETVVAGSGRDKS
jgi:hypothetical protein